jgi:hypothetical protein
MHQTRRITIVCDGGLGNRFGSLFPAFSLAADNGLDYVISWPVNNWCGCEFGDIFSPVHKFTSTTISEVAKLQTDDLFVLHENQVGPEIKNIIMHGQTVPSIIKNSKLNIVYYHNKIPPYVSQERILFSMNKFPLAEHIKKRVYRFCKDNDVKKNNVKGIHIRKTDHPSQVDDNVIFNAVKNDVSSRYFICSDDKDTEQKFSTLSNVIIHNKNFYVDKLVEGTWREKITDTEGRSFNFNVNRTKDSVIDGFVDMLILSRTNIIVKNNKSTFLEFAKLYSHINI